MMLPKVQHYLLTGRGYLRGCLVCEYEYSVTLARCVTHLAEGGHWSFLLFSIFFYDLLHHTDLADSTPLH